MPRYVSWLRIINLALAILAVVAPVAHVLELPNKLSPTSGWRFSNISIAAGGP